MYRNTEYITLSEMLATKGQILHYPYEVSRDEH